MVPSLTAANGPPALQPLSRSEQAQVQKLRARDAEVRAHEQAHAAAGGAHVTSGPSYTFQEGPDGRRYAVGGEVGIDTSPEGSPEETIRKMEQVRAAALAPANPSGQDQRVAAQAARTAAEARAELAAEEREAVDHGAGRAHAADPGPGRLLDLYV